ncbi:hypothetical protein RJ639_029080, partial [Escallonia herrerae]
MEHKRSCKDRAGKPILKWTENRQQDHALHASNKLPVLPEACTLKKVDDISPIFRGGKVTDLSELEFEARSSKDGAWYDVDRFLTHRFLSSGEAEVRVRFVGFGSEEDEWINVKEAVRERSVALEHSECQRLKVGDLERREQARYYDAHILEIQRRLHDIRGCRCLFLIRYDHDNIEASRHIYGCAAHEINISDVKW